MNKQDHITQQELKLAELARKEQEVKLQMNEIGKNIQQKATPVGIAKDLVTDFLPAKSGWGNAAKAAVGLGLTLVAGNVARKQQRLSLIGKVAGMAVGVAAALLASKKKKGT